MKHRRTPSTGHSIGRPMGIADEAPGPVGMIAAVLRRAVKDARNGNQEAAAWLYAWGELWARAAGLDTMWADLLKRRGLTREGDYMPHRDHPHVTADQPKPTGRIFLRYADDQYTRAVITALRDALASCDGNLAAALAELRGTPAGEKLLAWMVGE